MQRNSDTFNKFLKNYWRYYKELENELLSTSRYVEFVEDNFSTYSVEFLKLYQAVCSEIDVIGKMMASQVKSSFNPEDKQNNIYKWWYEIQDTFTYTEEYKDAMNIDSSIKRKKLQEVECCFIDTYMISPWNNFRTETYIILLVIIHIDIGFPEIVVFLFGGLIIIKLNIIEHLLSMIVVLV